MANSPDYGNERVLFEGQRTYIIANAAGALALLVFLQSIWLQAGAVSLKRWVLYGIAAFAIGVGVAMLGYVIRYLALGRYAALMQQVAHLWIPLIAVACFVAGLILPVIGGLDSLGSQQERPAPAPTQTLPKKR